MSRKSGSPAFAEPQEGGGGVPGVEATERPSTPPASTAGCWSGPPRSLRDGADGRGRARACRPRGPPRWRGPPGSASSRSGRSRAASHRVPPAPSDTPSRPRAARDLRVAVHGRIETSSNPAADAPPPRGESWRSARRDAAPDGGAVAVRQAERLSNSPLAGVAGRPRFTPAGTAAASAPPARPAARRRRPPTIHQLAGSRSYSVKPGVSAACRAAATGLTVSAASTVRWPNGASRPSQTSSGPTHTASEDQVGRGRRRRGRAEQAAGGRADQHREHGRQHQAGQHPLRPGAASSGLTVVMTT